MPSFRIVGIADVLRVSDDTVRRWIDTGELAAQPDGHGRRVVDGASAARFAPGPRPEPGPGHRNPEFGAPSRWPR